jgi:hypothetical protein
MKAITIRQPWASLIAAGVKTIETRSRLTAYQGRIAIHAAKARPPVVDFGRWSVPPVEDVLCEWAEYHGRPSVVRKVALPLGAVVASAVLTDCVPIVADVGETPKELACVEVDEGETSFWPAGSTDPDESVDVSDQLPYGDFTPGRWALLLDDIKPTTERCPWCWGAVGPTETTSTVPRLSGCPVCRGIGRCDPVPARGRQAVPWEWARSCPSSPVSMFVH